MAEQRTQEDQTADSVAIKNQQNVLAKMNAT